MAGAPNPQFSPISPQPSALNAQTPALTPTPPSLPAAFYFILQPIAALFSFFPFIARLISSLFLVAAIIVGLGCSLITIAGAWMVAKPARAAVLFVLISLAYLPAILYDGASIAPVVLFGAAAAASGVMASIQLYHDCKFQAAVKKTLGAATSYVQVGIALPVQAGGASGGKAKKEMM